MNILEGQLPQEKDAWRILIPRSSSLPLGKSWQLALLLAAAGEGSVLLAMTISVDTELEREAARATIRRATAIDGAEQNVYAFIVLVEEYERTVYDFVHELGVDILVDDIADPVHHDLNRISCAVAGVRGDVGSEDAPETPLKRILVPTSGGPNTVYALNTLLPLAGEVEIVALYVVPEHLGSNEEALGRHRLRQALEYIDAQQSIKTMLIASPNVTEGISEAARDFDLLVIGATRESSVDKILFGNIPDQVVRNSHTSVVVMREPKSRVAHVFGAIAWRLQRIIPRLNLSARTETYVRIRRSARPSTDYFILIGLATLIAGLGLVANSVAVVIGAMLVAPLMSPIVGSGLAIVLGDTRFLRLTLGAVVRGALLAIFLGVIVGIFQYGQPLTSELAARTQPSLLDLAIAIFSGMAAAFALSKSNAAGALPGVAIAAALVPPLATVGISFTAGYFVESLGALLLFVTNFVAISCATALVFIILGFRPTSGQKVRQQVRTRSAQVAAISLVVIAGLLAVTSYILGLQEVHEARIQEVVGEKLAEIADAELQDLNIIDFRDGNLAMEVIARSPRSIAHPTVAHLQAEIGEQLVAEGIIETIAMTLTVIRVTDLDPLVPPTPTPGPSPTPTLEPTASAEPEPLATP